MADDLYDLEEEVREPRRGSGLFLWTIFIMLLMGTAFACWLGSFYIFGHPEEPRCYRILKKLKKIEPPRRFDVTAAPLGEFVAPQKLYDRYTPLTRLELQKENAELLRIYIKNYSESKRTLPYIRGKFEVMDTADLTSADMFQTGVVSLLQSTDNPQVIVEHVFPTAPGNVELAKRVLTAGFGVPIEKTNDVTTVLHAERMADGRMLLTVVPLHYPSYGVRGGIGTFPSEPPADLNVAAELPITKAKRLDDVLKRWAKSKSVEPVEPLPLTKAEPLGPEVVRLDIPSPDGKTPETGALPEPKVAKAEAVLPATPTPRGTRPIPSDLVLNNTRPAIPAATPIPGPTANLPRTAEAVPRATPAPPPLLASATPLPALPPTASTMPPPRPAATPAPSMPPTTSPTGVPLKPFVQSNTGVAPPPEVGGTWRTYSPGTQPRGRTIIPSEAATLAGSSTVGDRLYLSGNFFVSAKGDNKAVLRPRGADAGAFPCG
jgi:hypothetical protein